MTEQAVAGQQAGMCHVATRSALANAFNRLLLHGLAAATASKGTT
jgi:hypothetical protein